MLANKQRNAAPFSKYCSLRFFIRDGKTEALPILGLERDVLAASDSVPLQVMQREYMLSLKFKILSIL